MERGHLMATTDTGVYYPIGSDEFAPHLDDQKQAESLTGRVIVPVANATARNDLAAQVSPSVERPLFVKRGDSGALEYTTDGQVWRTVGGIESFTSPAPTGGTFTASALLVAGTLATAPVDRLVHATANVYGAITSGDWDGALSAMVSDVGSAQKYGALTAPRSSVSLTWVGVVPAGVAPLIRVWLRRVSGTGSIVASNSPLYTNVQGWAMAL
jgi:hypothetical protein